MLLVDAYNVLHVTGVLPPEIAGPDVWALARLVEASRYRHVRAVLVCDGRSRAPAGSGDGGGVEIEFAGAGVEADARIEDLLLVHRGARTIVVSDDRRIRRAARKSRARWLGSAVFLGHLASDARSSGRTKPAGNALRDAIPLGESAVDRWMRLFGLHDEAEMALLFRSIDVSLPASVESRLVRATEEKQAVKQRPKTVRKPPEAPPREPRSPDPELERLLRESGTSIDPNDLEMDRWLGP